MKRQKPTRTRAVRKILPAKQSGQCAPPKQTPTTGSLNNAFKHVPATAADWYLRAGAYAAEGRRPPSTTLSQAAMACLRLDARDFARQLAVAARAEADKPMPVSHRIHALARITYVFEKVGDEQSARETGEKARAAMAPEEDSGGSFRLSFEEYRRGLEYNVGFVSSLLSVPMPVLEAFLDADAARRESDLSRCRAALRTLDREVENTLRATNGDRKTLLPIAGQYAILHSMAGNAEKVREILRKFKDPDNGPNPKEMFEALYLADDKQAAAAIAERELRQRLDELAGKVGGLVADNPHFVMGMLIDLLEVQWRLGDRDGVCKALEGVEDWLNGGSSRASDFKGWALSMLAHLELKLGRTNRARAAVEAAEEVAAHARGGEVGDISWAKVADAYFALGDLKKAEAAIKRIPTRWDKTLGKLALLLHRGENEEAAKLVEELSPELRTSACTFAAETLKENAHRAEM